MFKGKKYLILGVANEKSIAWGITSALHQAGAEIALTYANDVLEKRVRPLAEKIQCEHVFPCDVQIDQQIDALISELENRWGELDGIVHSVAYAERDDMQNRFSLTSREGFKLALDVSAYSLVAIAGRAQGLLGKTGGSVLTLSYLGAERVITNYNVMGVAKAALEASVRYLAADLGQFNIRVNAISAGPLKTLAASGIPQFKTLLAQFAERAPLRRNVTQEDVARAALFYLGPDSMGITGETTYVDCGFSIMGL
ncbi:MAG: enoyl-ACP reductase [Bdellovibrionales bacterium]|nr:enoyl-ACP reductase [Bdellovibrionales bacterium]